MRHLTEKQTRFVEYYVSERKTQTEAARLAGYPVPRQSAWRLLQTPRILEAIHQERQKVYETDLANLAVGALKQILIDEDAPAAACTAPCSYPYAPAANHAASEPWQHVPSRRSASTILERRHREGGPAA